VVAFNAKWVFSTVAISAEIHLNNFTAVAVNNVDKYSKQFMDVGLRSPPANFHHMTANFVTTFP
jgi:hypothetical protein